MWVLVALLLIAALTLMSLKLQWWSPSQSSLERRYGRPTSRFITVERTRLHFLDEGPPDAPLIVVLPPHWGCFAAWDQWVPAFTDAYRVIRLDLPGHGLSGRVPSGDYSMDMYVHLLHETVDQLDIKSFALVGTSFSGVVAFRYAARFSGSLNALILCNASGLPRSSNTSPNQAPPHVIDKLLYHHYRRKTFIEWKLKSLMSNQVGVTPEKVRLYTDMNNCKGRIWEERERLQHYDVGDPKTVLAQIQVATLIQWSSESLYLTPEDAGTFYTYLANAPKRKHLYPNAGHLIVEDIPEQLAKDARGFLDDILTGIFISN